MAVKVSEELGRMGCSLDEEDFRDALVELHKAMHPCWSVDELVCHPTDAIRYCEAVRARCRCRDMEDAFILRGLMNCRKQGLLNN